ncbi:MULTISPECIES: cardiolipin synthase [Gammaproteobacteria]|uniref:cardiolipin synthase n=1 Tax=Gammaproteobacteria TaxID=1236 RepID=UPI000DCFFA75|nr:MULTISPECIES: cardiolipin synthase [Gammaproteobacteria]RTE87218.1 cardiolipin synthase [Aliidiomarina sp. B3213]TCZ92994.1 cardiolipin synthase [Lysobacter sp. N42]
MAFSDFGLYLYWLFIASVLLRVVFRKRSSVSSSLAWILIIVLVPLFGVLLYLFFGEIQLGARRAERALKIREPFLSNLTSQLKGHSPSRPTLPIAQAVYDIMSRHLGTGGFCYHDLKVLSEPEEIFNIWIHEINNAQHSIRAAFYIWYAKGRVVEVADALIAARERGVKVELLIDHAGSWRFFMWHKDLKRMEEAGVEIISALPVSLWRNIFRRVDLRMHRKLLIIDNHTAFSGSMNMADPKYFNIGRQVGPWIDMVIQFNGAAAFGVSKVFSWDWEIETGERRFPVLSKALEHTDDYLTIVPSGPDIGRDVISQVLLVTIYRAKQNVILSTPYFVPSEAIFDALCHALQRGVKVTLVVPQKCDSRLAGWASRSFYEEFLKNGGEIHLFKTGLLHTKAILIDGDFALVGSVNLDARSFQLNFELTFALHDDKSCAQIESLLNNYLEQSERVVPDHWYKRNKLNKIVERLCYFLSPLL